MILALCLAGAGEAGTVLSTFGEAIDRLHDYTVTIRMHEASGRRMQDRALRYWYEKPSSAKVEVVDGIGRGSAAVWRGDSSVRGHWGGFLSIFRLTIGLHDPHATSLRGDSIDALSFFEIYRHVTTTKGELQEAPGPTIDGAATEALVLLPSIPAENDGITREVLYLSRATHLPIRRQCFEGETLVKDQQFVDLEINPGLTDGNFTL